MKKLLFLPFYILFCLPVFAQNKAEVVDSLINLGVSFHDQGQYAEAISRFEKALDIDKNATRAQYEMANTLIAVGRSEDAIKYANKVIKTNDKFVEQAYVLKGTAQDMLNQPEQAVKTYQKGLEQFPEEHMLWFNLSVTLLKNDKAKEAETVASKAVSLKPFHPGSNQMLGYAYYYQGKKSKTLLPLFHFLILENKSKRAGVVYKIVTQTMGGGVEQKDEKNISITLGDPSDPFSTTDLALAISAAAALTAPDSIVVLDEYTKMVNRNASFFEVLPNVDQKTLDDNFKYYIALFSDLHKKGHTEAFTYWIMRATEDEKVKEWMKKNEQKVTAFVDWFNAYGG